MKDKTKQKILDSSLKIFAERGYTGATTKILAEKAGFSEMTLFRKFETKKNLFKMVLLQNREKIMGDLDSALVSRDFKDPEDFFKTFLENIIHLIDKNFDFISIIIQGNSELFPTMRGTNDFFFNRIGQYLQGQEIIQKGNLEVVFFTFNVITFSYFIVLDRHRGRNSLSSEKLVEEFIKHHNECFKK